MYVKLTKQAATASSDRQKEPDHREQDRIGTGLIPERPDILETTYLHQGKEGAVKVYTAENCVLIR